ncbi:MAG: glucosidase family protein [Armatimonadota bacterium]
MDSQIRVIWRSVLHRGTVEVSNGSLESVSIAMGVGVVNGSYFDFTESGMCAIDVSISDVNLSFGANPTMVTIKTERDPFTFLLRDVNSQYPIYIPEYGVAVTSCDEARSFYEIECDIQAKGLQTGLQQIESEPEESWEDAAANTRSLRCPTWLGLSRDMRIFEVDYAIQEQWHMIRPKNHGYNVLYPDTSLPMTYKFTFSKGIGCSENITRRLEDGIYPILLGDVTDGGIIYNFTTFASLEKTPLTSETLRGTHFLVADHHGGGNMQTEEQLKRYEELLPAEMNRDEETVLYTRIQTVNTDSVPRYAWFKAPVPYGYYEAPAPGYKYEFDGTTGYAKFEDETVYSVLKLNGEPLPKEEVAVLIMPGETADFEFYIPHRPISAERASGLIAQDFDARHDECRRFWEQKLESAAKVKLPEKRVENMMNAGLYHLDLVTYGLEPDGPLAPTIGVYCPIGSESSPIIQTMDSFGLHKTAERAIEYFLEKQHDDGFIQNFGGYMLETGPALWTMGEHFRYTRDIEWVKRIAPKLILASDFILRWRERNLKEELRGHGYGMIEGKVADPEDPFRAFMLNGYAYIGLSRVAEMLKDVNPAESDRIGNQAAALKADIRIALTECSAKSPVVPLGDGSWCPSVPPWAEGRGPVGLLTDEYRWHTHGAFVARDSLLGPHYLALQEVADADELSMSWILSYHNELMHVRNVALSQPYYSCHPFIHLKRGEVKAFLKAYYNGFSGLADRETFSFWEHYMGCSPHKTHEEGWFLMQSRWMLYMEDGSALKLLPGIPRAWMEHGKSIEIKNAATYFGNFTLKVESQVDSNRITAKIACVSDCRPARIELRLPHPQGRKARTAKGGTYDSVKESVIIEGFTGTADVVLEF